MQNPSLSRRGRLAMAIFLVAALSACEGLRIETSIPAAASVIESTDPSMPTPTPDATVAAQSANTDEVAVTATHTEIVVERPTITAALTPTDIGIVPGTILYENDFEQDNPLDKFISKSYLWTVVSENTTNTVLDCNCVDDCPGSGIDFGSVTWSDYALDFRVKMINQNADVNFNFRNGQNGGYTYRLSLRFKNTEMVVNPDWQIVNTRTYTFLPGRWYDVRLESQGHTIRAFINGKLQAEIEDTRFSSGNVNFSVFPDSHAQYDDIRVTALQGN